MLYKLFFVEKELYITEIISIFGVKVENLRIIAYSQMMTRNDRSKLYT